MSISQGGYVGRSRWRFARSLAVFRRPVPFRMEIAFYGLLGMLGLALNFHCLMPSG